MSAKTHLAIGSISCIAALLLSACDGGGGGGGGGGGTTVTSVATGDLVDSDVEVDLSSGEITALTGQVGSDSIRYDATTGVLYVNGKEPGTWTVGSTELVAGGAAFGAAFGSYLDDGGNNRAFSTLVNYQDIFEVKSRVNMDYSWSNVPYSYLVGGAGEEAELFEGTGSISVVGDGNWEAGFGDVSLGGDLRNGSVSGEARLDDMSGDFEGVDGVITLQGNSFFVTNGAFAGDNGDNKNFAGVWEMWKQ